MRQMQGLWLQTIITENPGAGVLILRHRPSSKVWWYVPATDEARYVEDGSIRPLPDRDKQIWQLLGTLP